MYKVSVILLLLFCSACLHQIAAQTPVVINGTNEDVRVPLSAITFYEDSTLHLTFDEVMEPAFERNFKPAPSTGYRVSTNKVSYWLKFSLTGEALQNLPWVLEVPDWHTRYIDLYQKDVNGQWHLSELGSYRPSSLKQVDHKNYILKIPQNIDTVAYVARLYSDMRNPFLFNVRTARFIFEYSTKEYLGLGVFYGFLLILIIYNLVIFSLRRKWINFYFSFYIIACIFLCTAEDGIGFQFFWPENPHFNFLVENYAIFFFLLGFLMYASSFLELPKRQPVFFKIIVVATLLNTLFHFFNIGAFQDDLISNSINIPFLLIFISAIRGIYLGFKPAKYFLIALCSTMVGVIVLYLRRNAYLDLNYVANYYLVFYVYALNVALLVELLVFFIAQTQKVRYDYLEKEAQMKESEAKFKSVFENSFDSKIIYDVEHDEIVDANQQAVQFFQCDKGCFLTCSMEDVLLLGNNKEEAYSDCVKRNIGTSFETFALVKGERKIECELSISSINKNNRELVVFSINDISQRKEAEHLVEKKIVEITNKNNELKKYINSNSELQNFAYVASHDMKQPLRSIKSFSTLLSKNLDKKGLLDQDVADFVHYIKTGVGNLESLIEDLLTHAKFTSEDSDFYDEVNLNDILLLVRYNLSKLIVDHDVILEIEELPDCIKVSKVKIIQLFQNMIANAIKFRKEEESCKIIIRSQEEEDHWVFSIQDNGIGIAKEYFEQIFVIFRKLHTPSQYKGSGIGLATCKKIVEQHGGDIWVDSEEGEGACFYFTISKKIAQRETPELPVADEEYA